MTDLLSTLKEAREALQFANDSPGGAVSDTIWMMHRPETLFDFLDAAIASAESAIVPSTPAAAWRQAGEPDPHAGHYDCERAKLTMGHLTDDELANGAFMNYDQPLNVQGVLAGTHASPIAWMTAVKDRIRWLSRALEHSIASRAALAAKLADMEQQDPVAWANSDELDNILEDRLCMIRGTEDGFRRTPLYRNATFKHRPAGGGA